MHMLQSVGTNGKVEYNICHGREEMPMGYDKNTRVSCIHVSICKVDYREEAQSSKWKNCSGILKPSMFWSNA